MISLEQQIACVAREIALRRAVYPGFIARGKMKQEKADYEIAAMEAVIETLKAVRDGHGPVEISLDAPRGA